MAEHGPSDGLAEWLDARLEDVDTALATRVRAAIDDAGADAARGAGARVGDAPRILVSAAVARLAPLAADGCTARASAIELLAVDTLVTLACEALADTSASTDEIESATTAMIGALGATMPELDGAA